MKSNVFAGCLLAVLSAPALVFSQTEKPNILIIWGDDIGQYNISAYNMELVRELALHRSRTRRILNDSR